eukprot:EG_transcript_10876
MSYFALYGVALLSSTLVVSSFKAPTVSLDDLLHPSWATLSTIEQAVTEVGFFAVTLNNEQEQQKTEALKELITCIRSDSTGEDVNVVEMADNTVRSTIATATNQSIAREFSPLLKEQCPAFVTLAESVRSVTATVGNAYAKVLDKMELKDLSAVLGPFEGAVARSENLEHFHVYWRREERNDDTPTLRMHTDLGMYIVMTPPQYFHFSGTPAGQRIGSGFEVKLPNGETVTPEFPAGSVVVMNGEGCADWIESTTAKSLYAPPHQVLLPSGTLGIGRTWYGRMFLPPRDSLKQDEKRPVTFNQYWTGASAALVQTPTKQAALGHRNLVDQGNCAAGQLYCWMSCMNASIVSTCPSDVQNLPLPADVFYFISKILPHPLGTLIRWVKIKKLPSWAAGLDCSLSKFNKFNLDPPPWIMDYYGKKLPKMPIFGHFRDFGNKSSPKKHIKINSFTAQCPPLQESS